MTTYKWHEFYNAAVLETDWSQMAGRIQAAESAITGRLRELSLNHAGAPEENQAIVDALNRLNTLRAEVARWRESNTPPTPGTAPQGWAVRRT